MFQKINAIFSFTMDSYSTWRIQPRELQEETGLAFLLETEGALLLGGSSNKIFLRVLAYSHLEAQSPKPILNS